MEPPPAQGSVLANGYEAVAVTGSGNVIQGNYIGTDVSGTLNFMARSFGIDISSGSNNTVGGTTPAAQNIILSATVGVSIATDILAATPLPASGNVIEGNDIGLDLAGQVDLGTFSTGVLIFDASGNTIGGTASGTGNVIAVDYNGVAVETDGTVPALGNLVLGNSITSTAGSESPWVASRLPSATTRWATQGPTTSRTSPW